MSSSISSVNFAHPNPKNRLYDVYISFFGEDTRHGFTTNLFEILKRNNIHTFMDSNMELDYIYDIEYHFDMIGISKVALVVYSKNFTSSEWCLKELELIMQRMKDKKMLVIPIFYNVYVHELECLTGKIGEDLDEHISDYGETTVQKWKDAVEAFSQVSGFSNKLLRNESHLIAEVIVRTKQKLKEIGEILVNTSKPYGKDTHYSQATTMGMPGMMNSTNDVHVARGMPAMMKSTIEVHVTRGMPRMGVPAMMNSTIDVTRGMQSMAMPAMMKFTNDVAEQFKGQDINFSNVDIESRKNGLSAKEKEFARPCSRDGHYGVYICFRDIDTRSGFTDPLYRSLLKSKIYTFADADLFRDTIETLYEIIGRSRMAVVVYSERFASSDRCLRELEMILQRWQEGKMLMIPIIYNVNVQELKYPTKKTINYFRKHLKKYDEAVVEKWKNDVYKIGYANELSYKEDDDVRCEHHFIMEVADIIKKELGKWKEESSTSKPYDSNPAATKKNHNVSKPWTSSSRMAGSSYGGIDTKVEEGRFKSSVTEMNAASKRMGKLELSSNNQQQSNQAMQVAEQFKGQGINFTNAVSKSKNAISYEYDVFLSFRGDDTRESFASTLFYALTKVHKVKTFMDVIFRKGSKLEELLKMVEKSRMSIVVFSENFAESEWCLKELAKIFEENDRRGHEVVPVFYKVNPSELRNQDIGKTKVHMEKHHSKYGKESNTVKSWSNAMKELGNSSGYTYWSGRGKQEIELAEEIAQEILNRLQDEQGVL